MLKKVYALTCESIDKILTGCRFTTLNGRAGVILERPPDPVTYP